MLISIAILVYLIFGIFDAVSFRTAFPNHNNIELFFAMALTPAVKLFILVKNNILPTIILLYIIYR